MNTKFLLLVALVLGACDANTDTNTDDDTGDDTGDTTPTLYEASFTASLNQYGWGEGDEVVLLGSADKAAGFIATHKDGDTVSGTTPEILELAKGTWSSSYFYDESTSLYLGWASASLEDTSDLSATLCADLSGDWECWRDYQPENIYDTRNAEMDGCSIQLDGIATGSHRLEIDGNKVSATLSDGSSIDGVVFQNSIEMVVSEDDIQFNAFCERE